MREITEAMASTIKNRFWPLVPCAGTGSRAGVTMPKQYIMLAGKPLVMHTLAALAEVAALERATVVIAPDDVHWAVRCKDFTGTVAATGGQTRAHSVRNGLAMLRDQGAADEDWVLVHDAARCLLRAQWVQALIERCRDDAVGGLLAQPLSDTLKQAMDGRSVATLPRTGKWLAQTPQMFRLSLLERALDYTQERGIQVTDEASAVEALGLQPLLVACSADNFKLTYPEDFARAENILHARTDMKEKQNQDMKTRGHDMQSLRIGEGWDSHRLVSGRPLILGGVSIAHDQGLQGHSDADVLLHAITDAVLGAAGQGDIGRHFPDTDARYQGADSALLLRSAMDKVAAEGWRLGNLDATIIAQAPKLAPHMNAIRARVAQILDCEEAQVNIKAKTAEKLGPVGEGLSMEARAVCWLYKK